MNFIKKKLKGHKKDDEEEEYEKAVCEQSLHGQSGEQRMKNTEEWQFFQQLSSKVQETVQKTQTSLNKLKDNRLDNLDNPDNPENSENYDSSFAFSDSYQSTGGFMEDDKSVPFGTPKPTRAPPRPPPPAAEKAWVAVESDSEFDFTQGVASKGPPRPPPPSAEKVSNFQFGSDTSSALIGSVSKSAPSPARPPPPTTVKSTLQTEDDLSFFSQPPLSTSEVEQTKQSLSLLEEFGFQTEVPAPSAAQSSFQDLLFLEEKEEIDPFDTSFVDVTNISSKQDQSAKESEVDDQNFNPFSKVTDFASLSHSQSNGQSDFIKSGGKAATNPFFVESIGETQKSDQTEDLMTQQWTSLNPFSESQPSETTNVSNADLLGDVFISSTSKDIIGDTFHKNEQSLLASLKRDSADNIFSSVSEQKGSDILTLDSGPQTDILSDVFETGSTTGIKQPWAIEGELDLKPVKVEKQGQPNYFSDLSGLDHSSIIWDTDAPKVEEPVVAAPDLMNGQTDEETEKMDGSVEDIKPDVVEDEKPDVVEDEKPDVIEDEQPDADSVNVLDDFFGSDITSSQNGPVISSDPFESIASLPCDTELKPSEECIQPLASGDAVVDDLNFPTTEVIEKQSEDVFGSLTEMKLNEESSDLGDNATSATDTDAETAESLGTLNPEPVVDAQSDLVLSQPFDSSDQFGAFTFKVQKGSEVKSDLAFDAFSAKFDSVKDNQESDPFDAFMTKKAPNLKYIKETNAGFGSMDEFDPFKVTANIAVESTHVLKKEVSRDSFEEYDNEGSDFSVVIKPKVKGFDSKDLLTTEAPKLLPPPPKTPTKAFDSSAPRFNPFDKDYVEGSEQASQIAKGFEPPEPEEEIIPALGEAGIRKSESQESPLSPLFDEDTSQPIEPFPKPPIKEGWEMVLRQPNKKKLTGNRFWKKIFVKLSDNSVLQLLNKQDDKVPFQELPLQACYSLSEIGAQQYDQYGKIFTVKLQYKFYRERVGVRPGQISKVTQGQVTSMGDVAKLGLPLQHSPQTSQLLKIGTHSYPDIKHFIMEVEDALFRMVVHRDRVLTYKTEEVQVIAQDEFYVEQSKTGHVDKQLARVRVFFLAFITGMPSVEVGLNDINRQGKEVVGRYDIIPVVTEEWIRLEECEFHSCVIQDEFYKNRVIKFHPPDACLFELLRFRIRPPKNRELPLQVRVFMSVTSSRVEIRSDILVPGYSSRKQGQIPCENIQIRFPIPECWIYFFRTEKHFRYGSKKSTARRPGKIKGLERIIGAAQSLDPSLIEVSAGQAKYEHVFHAVVWRIPRLPKEGQGAYTQQLFLLRMELTSFDQIPESFEKHVLVEFTMPATYVSHTTVRSVSVTNPNPPEKYVRYISKHEYKVEIDFKSGTDDIDGLISSSTVRPPVSTSPAVQESTEDEKDEDDDDDSD